METFGELPAVTLALPVVQDEGDRWTRWGAATSGAKQGLGAVRLAIVGLCGAVGLAVVLATPRLALTGALTLVTTIYLSAGTQKLVSLIAGIRSKQVAAPLYPPDPLPVYSVLVPLYRESAILPALVNRLSDLDYPVDRIEILLLTEKDDEETQRALRDVNLPDHFRIVEVPDGAPRTKPRALNVGLSEALGEYVVVYDAEDWPEPDQLKKAASQFSQSSSRLVCLQARLGAYNTDDSWLTRLFSLDYLIWFHALLPGLDLVPLGGTSNHFRTRALRRLGGWDPYNVTEDADLGVRIARASLEIGLLDSQTNEEAIPTVRAWLRQRSRWVKGYLQTYLVHTRAPRRLASDLGWKRLLTFQGAIGASMLTLLVNPLMWALTITYFMVKGTSAGAFIESLFPAPIYYGALLCLVIGNFLYVYLLLYTAIRYGLDRLAHYALLGPLYWALMSVGAWAGLISLLRDPYYWAKTEHGASLQQSTGSSGRQRGRPQVALPEAKRACLADTAPYAISATSALAARPAVRVATRVPLAEHQPSQAAALSVVIPAYNEAQRLPPSLKRLRDYVESRASRIEVIVVDDGSTDGTIELVRAWMAHWPALRLVAGEHMGKGAAIRAGVFAARGEYVAMADADFSMPAREFDRFLPTVLGPYDVALGSRAAKGARRLGEPWHRHVMSVCFNLIARTLLVRGIHDTQCGFKCLRREAALDLCAHQTVAGWGFDVELLHIARLRGYRIREVPINWRYVPGSRVQPLRAALAMLRDLWRIRLNSWRGVYAESGPTAATGIRARPAESYLPAARLAED